MYLPLLWILSISLKVKSSSSHTLRGICSATFDVEDVSCKGIAALHPAETYSRSVSPETVANTTEQQREPKRSQINKKTQTSFVGAEDVRTEPSSPNVAASTAADKTDVSDGDEVEDKEEPQNTEVHEPDPHDPSQRPGSAMSTSELAMVAATNSQSCEMLNKEGVGEHHDEDADDVGIREEGKKLDEAEEQTELIDEVVETTKEAPEGDNPLKSCPAEPDVDSSSILSKHPGRFIIKQKDDRIQKRERSFRYLKVLL